MALDNALDDLSERMGDDMGRWRWDRIHITQYPHNPFSQVSYPRPSTAPFPTAATATPSTWRRST